MKTTLEHLRNMKARGEKIAMLTCYDYPGALWQEEAGVDIIFVGDSLGTNLLGYASEQEVTMADMLHHLRAVRRGVQSAYLMVDMPYRTYETPAQAMDNAARFLAEGADSVKVEGDLPDTVRQLARANVEVCVHLGYTPQGGEKPGMRGKTAAGAKELVRAALAADQAGAAFVLFEAVPEEVARYASERVRAPTIGIGAGRYTDGQVLVLPDLLGASSKNFLHNRRYDEQRGRSIGAIRAYVEDVRAGRFPGEENLRHLAAEELEALKKAG